VPGVKDVEDAVGEHDDATLLAQALHQRHGFVTEKNAAQRQVSAQVQSFAGAGPRLKRMAGENVQR